MDFGVYLHVPFCRVQCPYCTFYTVPKPQEQRAMPRFLEALAGEWRQRVTTRLQRGDRLRTLYFGGGTPSDLPTQAFVDFVRGLGSDVPGGLAALDEATVECNPESATPQLLDALLDTGVGRISLGVQALDADDLRTLGRAAAVTDVRRGIHDVAQRFRTWNADLILGVPGSDVTRLTGALQELRAANAPHLSFYCLELPAGLARRLGDAHDEPADAFKASLYEHASAWVGDHGYEHYEISNAARPGHQALHNNAYWEGREYVGLGPGAHSWEAGARRANRPDLRRYLEALEQQREPVCSVELLSPEQRARERVLLGLRRASGLDLAALGAPARRGLLEHLARDGLAELENGRFRLTPKGWLVSDSIILQLVAA